jgi:CubicO group peptidase (beta-lactamase class C family)
MQSNPKVRQRGKEIPIMCELRLTIVAVTLFCLMFVPVSSPAAQPITQSRQEVTIPDTPAGKQLKNWLEVFASGNQRAFERFIAEHYSKALLAEDKPVDRADRQARSYLDARNFDIRKLEKSTDQEITVLAQATLTGLWFRLTMKVETNPPHIITEYTSQRIQPPTGSQRKLNERELVKEIRAFMDKLAAADAFSGTLLVAKDGKPILKFVHGLANKGYNVPNRLDTKLNVASIGKMFTAVAVGQLVDQGKLSFTDTVGKHLPDYPNKQVAEKVTIHHLLTHSSGLGDFHGAKYVCLETYLRQVRDYFPLFVNEPLSFEPGARWQYSNAGFVLLGAIVEKVSGENYFDYVRNHVFKPAGMINTDYYESDLDTPNLAMGYTNFVDLGDDYVQFRLGPRRNTSRYGTIKGSPAGGASSTLEDLLRFSLALRSNKLMSAKLTDLMTSSKILARKYDAGQTLWGYGFELEEIDGKRVIGHSGGDLGVSSAVRWYPNSGNYTVVVLSNYDRGGILTIVKIQEMIIQQSLTR